jgi:hypothetical protein
LWTRQGEVVITEHVIAGVLKSIVDGTCAVQTFQAVVNEVSNLDGELQWSGVQFGDGLAQARQRRSVVSFPVDVLAHLLRIRYQTKQNSGLCIPFVVDADAIEPSINTKMLIRHNL